MCYVCVSSLPLSGMRWGVSIGGWREGFSWTCCDRASRPGPEVRGNPREVKFRLGQLPQNTGVSWAASGSALLPCLGSPAFTSRQISPLPLARTASKMDPIDAQNEVALSTPAFLSQAWREHAAMAREELASTQSRNATLRRAVSAPLPSPSTMRAAAMRLPPSPTTARALSHGLDFEGAAVPCLGSSNAPNDGHISAIYLGDAELDHENGDDASPKRVRRDCHNARQAPP